ncbi:MAG: terminase family protein, partial [Acidobacteriota bacterium]
MAALAEREVITIRPQPGPQEAFLASPADIAIYGGAAFAGKSWALLAEALRNVHNPDFGWVIFRRTYTQVTNEGGLWDESEKMFPLVGAIPKESALEWNFPSGATGHFAHLQHENNKLDWQGSQIPYIGFDELTHFTRGQFFYMLSRNRSTCGVRPYIRGTCNPDPDSFVAELIAWWIDQDSGYPLPERSGVLRYFVRDGDRLVWADSRAELAALYPDRDAAHDFKSLTFVAGSIEDNAIGMA